MRSFLILAAVLFVALGSAAMAQPVLVMQDTVDWGVIVPDAPLGQPAKAREMVVLKNTGDELLRITEVRPGCGCTSAPLKQDTLAPGEETTIDVTLNLPLANGPLSKVITIRSNDPERPSRLLYLIADVQRPLQLSASFIPFNKGKVGERITGMVGFDVQGQKDISVTARADQSDVEIITPMPLVIKPGTRGTVEVAYNAQRPGPFTVKVHFTTDQNGYESFDLSGYGVADPED